MMPDLGTYAAWVLGAYAVTLGALAGITALSLVRAARVRRALAEVEARRARAPSARAASLPPEAAPAPLAEAADG